MNRFLVTTSLEETWPDEGPVLFLGEWCRRYSRRRQWDSMESAVAPYHWDDRRLAATDYRYLWAVYERLLQDLARDLNLRHGTDRSVRSWQILVGPWLGYFVQMLYDRWRSIESVVASGDLSGTIVLDGIGRDLVPEDMMGFMRLFVREEWNHFIYAEILKRVGGVDLERIPHVVNHAPDLAPPPSLRWSREPRVAALAAWSRLVARHVREGGVVMVAPYMSWPDEMSVYLRFRQVPIVWSFVPITAAGTPAGERNWKMTGQPLDRFEQFVRDLVPCQIPSAYVEGFSAVEAHLAESLLPSRPKVIFTSNSHITNDTFKAWAAICVDQGARLVTGQHGGNFGVAEYNFPEDHERSIADAYLTWGWSDPTDHRAIPVGQLRGCRPLGVRHSEQPTALLITTVGPRNGYYLMSQPFAGQWSAYLEDQFEFAESLTEDLRSALLVRLFKTDYGWDQAERWQDRCPDVRLDEGCIPIRDLFRQTRVVLCTYNATTFLESFAMDIPTIMFWNPEHWELRHDAAPAFGLLEEAGILFRRPADAALKLVEIWEDVDGWWQSDPVLSARQRFCELYNWTPDDLVARVAGALRRAVSAPPDPEARRP